MANEKIKAHANEMNVRLWMVAMKMGITDSYFSRKLRKEFSEEESSKIMHYIDEIAREKETED